MTKAEKRQIVLIMEKLECLFYKTEDLELRRLIRVIIEEHSILLNELKVKVLSVKFG